MENPLESEVKKRAGYLLETEVRKEVVYPLETEVRISVEVYQLVFEEHMYTGHQNPFLLELEEVQLLQSGQ